MTRLQATLRRTSDGHSKAMLQAVTRLLNLLGQSTPGHSQDSQSEVETVELSKHVQAAASSAVDVRLTSHASREEISQLIAQCQEIDPEGDIDEEDAAAVLINVFSGLKQVESQLQKLSERSDDLVSALTWAFEGLGEWKGHVAEDTDGREQMESAMQSQEDAVVREPSPAQDEVDAVTSALIDAHESDLEVGIGCH